MGCCGRELATDRSLELLGQILADNIGPRDVKFENAARDTAAISPCGSLSGAGESSRRMWPRTLRSLTCSCVSKAVRIRKLAGKSKARVVVMQSARPFSALDESRRARNVDAPLVTQPWVTREVRGCWPQSRMKRLQSNLLAREGLSNTTRYGVPLS